MGEEVDATPGARSKERVRALWAKGDYGEVARRMQPAADALVAAGGIVNGERVVDVAAGTGNVAVAAARQGASVVAIDISPELVVRGRARCRASGLPVEWRVADAEMLPFDNGSFDAALSAFGVVYAARPEEAVAELFRVVAVDGVVGVANWAQGSFQDAVDSTLRAVSQGGPVPNASVDWGDPGAVGELVVPFATTVTVGTGRIAWCFDSLEDWLDRAEQVSPTLVTLREELEEKRFDELRWAVREAAEPFVVRTRHGILLNHEYIIVTARKR